MFEKNQLIKVEGEPLWKIDRLQQYKNQENCDLILFRKTDKTKVRDNILIYDLEQAFNKFTETDLGKLWINSIK